MFLTKFNDAVMDTLWDDLILSPQRAGTLSDIVETDDSIKISVDMPGCSEDKVRVEVNGQIISMYGERKQNSFRKEYRLPSTVDMAAIEAVYEAGVLTITAPKRAESKAKAISVKFKR